MTDFVRWIVFHFYLKPLIKRNYRLRAQGVLPDEWYWADELAFSWGYCATDPLFKKSS